ncbi:hypothetical protein TNIN_253881 [Trichonephila inaurata madagascariensis]|uniref:Uncharacterized protein n=1 Tax=Trichonephila inaurata madagascariensis TaxID=2747483 RepID=A0A8X7CGI9_9ARAC|nr:hypothetical protein TNIN_253871 [Trichonephila inaurata madagascariensis]GFY65781.1 hypothetical protein TNIN_253881 [Trichonephila inaurata madagascariensis]
MSRRRTYPLGRGEDSCFSDNALQNRIPGDDASHSNIARTFEELTVFSSQNRYFNPASEGPWYGLAGPRSRVTCFVVTPHLRILGGFTACRFSSPTRN